jgi:hypothetical protein
MRGYTVLVLAIAAVAGLLSVPVELARRLLGHGGAGMSADAAAAESRL